MVVEQYETERSSVTAVQAPKVVPLPSLNAFNEDKADVLVILDSRYAFFQNRTEKDEHCELKSDLHNTSFNFVCQNLFNRS